MSTAHERRHDAHITLEDALITHYLKNTTQQPPDAPLEYDQRFPKTTSPTTYHGLHVSSGTHRKTRQPPLRVPSPDGFTPNGTYELQWWEDSDALPSMPNIQNQQYLCKWAHILYDATYASWLCKCITRGWPSLSQIPGEIHRVLRKATIAIGTTQDAAFQTFLRWQHSKGMVVMRHLPTVPGTQTMTPGCAIKYAYDGSWKARATVNGGPHLHARRNTRAEYIDRTQIAYTQQPIIDMLAAILTHNLQWATITDYEKFFLYLQHLPEEIASNCVYYRGKYWYFLGKCFGARGTPFAAHCYGDLLQQIQQYNMDTIIHHPSCIYRRVDDQAFLTHTQEEAQTAYRVFSTVTETAGCPVQWDKSIIATRLFKSDGYMFDLIRQRVGIPKEKRTYMGTTIHRLLRHARKKECEKFQGLLEWMTTILIQLRTCTVAFRKAWMSVPPDSRVNLSPQAISDLHRFAALAQTNELWTSMSYFFHGPCSITLYTDASGHGGLGAYITNGPWLSHQLPRAKFDQHAAILRHGTTEQSSTYIELVALNFRATNARQNHCMVD